MAVYLNIGSNQGDRQNNLDRAVALIALAWPDAVVTRSSTVESDPWGYLSANKYLNVGVRLDFDGDEPEPLAILDTLQAIEREISPMPHRNRDGSYRDRTVDIDIITIDDVMMNTPRLTLPHPRAHLRDFVLIPLAALGGSLTPP